MQFNSGDRVKFLNDTGGGIITGFRDEKTAVVITPDGFEVPVPVKELIPDRKWREAARESHGLPRDTGGHAVSGQSRKDPDPGAVQEKRMETRVSGESSGFVQPAGAGPAPKNAEAAMVDDRAPGPPEKNLLLAFVETGTAGKLDSWLINDSSYNVLYNLMTGNDDSYRTLKAGIAEPDTKIFAGTYTRDQLNAFVAFRLQAVFFTGGVFTPVSPSQREITIDPVQVHGGLVPDNDFFEEKAFIIPVISDAHEREVIKMSEQEVARIVSEKDNKQRTEAKKEKADPLVEEVDLHIEELVDDHSGMSGKEVLDAQMLRFTTALEGALRGKTRRIIFIHGVGNGKLKYELRKTLERKYARLKYQDASYREYGYGATMVILR
jgi:hypothetical protein